MQAPCRTMHKLNSPSARSGLLPARCGGLGSPGLAYHRSVPRGIPPGQENCSTGGRCMDHQAAQPTVSRVALQNYKNIARCDVTLQPLSLLVGPNGSGKSNFVDALRFVADALRTTLEHALRDRGGINEVRRRSRGHPTHFGIRLHVRLPKERAAVYAFQVAAKRNGGFRVQREECRIYAFMQSEEFYVVEDGEVKDSSLAPKMLAAIEPDRLYLTLASALPPFRLLYDTLSRMGFYNLNPERIRDLQDPDPGHLLARDGRNLAAVVRRLDNEEPMLAKRINEYLGAVVPGITSVVARTVGPKETLEFRQKVAEDEAPWRFLAANMSDGTLRVLGVLVAAFQATSNQSPVPLVAIEEPEVAIHPGAAAKLMDALMESSRHGQLLITTHSPELLDHPGIDPSSILAVEAKNNESMISPVREKTLDTVRARLYTVGELLRLDQLRPDPHVYKQATEQLRLFGNGGSLNRADRADR